MPEETEHRVANILPLLPPGVSPTTVNRIKQAIGSQRCKATSNSTGTRCQLQAVTGAEVCHIHGGAKGTAGRSAADRRIAAAIRERLEAASDSAMGVMERILEDEEADDRVRLQAARDVLDRAGFTAIRKQQIEDVTPRGERSVDDEIEELLARRAKEHAARAEVTEQGRGRQ